MNSYFSGQPLSSNTQTNYEFQAPMFSGFHNSSQSYFHNNQAKQQPLFEEDPFQFFADVDSHQTGNFSPSAFTSFDIFGTSPHGQSHFDKERVCENFNFDLDFTSFKTEAEPISVEAFKQTMYHCKPSTAGTFKDCDQDFVAENELHDHHTLPNTPMESVECEQQEQEKSAAVTNNGLKGWSEDDEKLLKKLAVQYKFDWKKIAKKFDNKKYTPHFLKMRYKGYDEGPVPKRVKFTHEEDVLIAKYFNEYGVDWEKMVSHFPNRTPIMLKNRYYSHIRKNRKLEGLLKEIEEHETNYISQCMSQIGDNAELSATSVEDTYSQFQTEVLIDLSEKKSSGKKSNKKDKVAQLKAQLKSMKSLYVAAYRELNKLRGNQEAI